MAEHCLLTSAAFVSGCSLSQSQFSALFRRYNLPKALLQRRHAPTTASYIRRHGQHGRPKHQRSAQLQDTTIAPVEIQEERLQKSNLTPEHTGSITEKSGVVPTVNSDAEKSGVVPNGLPETEAKGVVAAVKMEMENMGHKDTDLISRPIHYFWVASACTALTGLLLKGAIQISGPASAVACAAAAVLAYLIADMATGFYHFGVDNYGNASTPVFGSQIDAFQGHHRRPWTITKRQFANNLQALALPVFFTTLLLLSLPLNLYQETFGAVFFACVMFSQQFHAWAHTPKKLLPPPVIALQDAGLLVSRRMHGAHHRAPFDCNYCIVSGICNGPMDQLGVFGASEKLIFETLGVAPRSWSSAVPDWLQDNSAAYYEDGSDLID